jgi:hypothetical protein
MRGRGEVGLDISASPAASLADKARLDIGQPDLVAPPIGWHRDRMAALVVRAIDQNAIVPAARILPKVIFTWRGS